MLCYGVILGVYSGEAVAAAEEAPRGSATADRRTADEPRDAARGARTRRHRPADARRDAVWCKGAQGSAQRHVHPALTTSPLYLLTYLYLQPTTYLYLQPTTYLQLTT